MNIPSPVTGSFNTRVVELIPISVLVDSYKSDLDIDVFRFLKGIDKIHLCECLDTGYLFYYPFNISGDELFYDQLKIQMPAKYNSPYYPVWKWEFEICSKLIKRGEKVYEIGCGVGNFLLKLKETGVSQVFGTELNQASVDEARACGLNVERITIQEKANNCAGEYDVVCAFQVLEHIAEVKSFIDASVKILKEGGRLMVAVPYNNPFLFENDKYNTLNMPPHHMGLWGRRSFTSLVKFFPIVLEELIVEKLPNAGYDFNQYFTVNKDRYYRSNWPFKSIFDGLYYRWLKRNHLRKDGKNIIAIFRKSTSGV